MTILYVNDPIVVMNIVSTLYEQVNAFGVVLVHCLLLMLATLLVDIFCLICRNFASNAGFLLDLTSPRSHLCEVARLISSY